MAGDVVLDANPPNPCCAELKKKYKKLEEGRNALRQAVKLLQHETNKLIAERDHFKKAHEDEQLGMKTEKDAQEKESAIRHNLEEEIHDLRSELASYQKSVSSRGTDELQICISKGETEIKRLKSLLEKEEKRADLEKKRADAENKRAAEAWNLLKAEKSKVEEQRKIAETERKNADDSRRTVEIERNKAEEYKLCLEKIQKEAVDIREKSALDANKRVEAERQKASNEKKKADSERRKAEEQSRLVEMERRKVMQQNASTSLLSEQLEEEKRRREELEKKLNETLSAQRVCKNCSCSKGTKNNSTDIEGADVKLLRQQLKLRKKQAKYAKKMARLEKEKMSFIKHQFYLLKQDFTPFSCRLNLLDSHLSNCGKGTQAAEKIAEPSVLPSFNLHNNVLAHKPYNLNSDRDFGMINTCYKDSHKTSGLRREDIGNQLSRRCTRPISGTNSEWESPIGDSFRKKSPSSAVCSTTTSFSHKGFMGSQGRDALSVSASTKLVKNHSNLSTTIPEVTDEFAENGVVAEKADRKYLKRLLGSLDSGNEASQKASTRGRKKRKILDALETIAWLYSVDSDLHLKTRQELSSLTGLFSSEDRSCAKIYSQSNEKSKHLDAEKSPLTKKSDGQSQDPCKNKQKEPFGQSQDQKQMKKFGSKVRSGSLLNEISVPVQKMGESLHECRVGPIDTVTNGRAALVSFENVICGDYMKLLNLDNDLDERRYREAAEMPLSPTLPEIHFNYFQLCEDDSHYLVEGPFRSETISYNLVAFHASDVIKSEIESNASKLQISKAKEQFLDLDRYLCPSQAGVSPASRKEFIEHGSCPKFSEHPSDQMIIGEDIGTPSLNLQSKIVKNICQVANVPDETHGTIKGNVGLNQSPANDTGSRLLHARNAAQTGIHQLSSSSMEEEATLEGPVSYANGYPHGRSDGFKLEDTMCLVVFSNTNNEGSISKIFHAFNSIVDKNCTTSVVNFNLRPILHALAFESDLLPEHKIAVFFSLLLYCISGMTSANSTCATDDEFLTYSKAFAMEMIRVISDEKAMPLFQESCQLNILLNLIQDFLVMRKVLMCVRLGERSFHSSYRKFQCLDGQCLLFEDATHSQLVAGSIILASICAAFDHTAFLLETSYKIIRMCRTDTSWILSVLHLFASVCGPKYFAQGSYSFLLSAIRLVVSFLERRQASVHSISTCLIGESNLGSSFSPCEECPFSTNAGCEDRFMSLLLDVLHHVATYEHNINVRQDFGGQISECSASCPLSKYKKHGVNCSDLVAERNLCSFSDILSLVELVAYYKSWEWTCDKIVPRLVSIMQSCVVEDYVAALCLLLGQLARVGVEACGFKHKGVAEVRHHLRGILNTCIGGKRSLPLQFAAVTALLNLLPVSFSEITDEYSELSTVDTEQSDHIKLMRKWFSQLTKKHQSLSLDLFMSGDGLQKLG
ncbi:hypothetical protein J5N97_009028 [Dioscorea zingiberensis]|uniref:Maternal effect embryo arrest 22 n=1 Tax=Dioscorea zingiberensis TaxID=325984 RepID=A0A9D5CWT9_9LILI|nr:hypothetical protein J5N97_009028 [Dioscorea zingiberensis]